MFEPLQVLNLQIDTLIFASLSKVKGKIIFRLFMLLGPQVNKCFDKLYSFVDNYINTKQKIIYFLLHLSRALKFILLVTSDAKYV